MRPAPVRSALSGVGESSPGSKRDKVMDSFLVRVVGSELGSWVGLELSISRRRKDRVAAVRRRRNAGHRRGEPVRMANSFQPGCRFIAAPAHLRFAALFHLHDFRQERVALLGQFGEALPIGRGSPQPPLGILAAEGTSTLARGRVMRPATLLARQEFQEQCHVAARDQGKLLPPDIAHLHQQAVPCGRPIGPGCR